MSGKWMRRKFVVAVLSALGLSFSGCGTIFYPERRGQPAGKLDWKVVAFDALGLLLFFIPGVIAFAVDFATGAIYLPPDYYSKGQRPDPARDFTSLKVPPEKLDQAAIAKAVSEHTGQPVELVEGGFTAHELASLEEFWTTHDRLLADREAA